MGAIASKIIQHAAANKGRPYDEAFLELVKITPRCWLWQGAKSSTGYGNFHNDGAHRIVFLLANGELPEGKWILHHCDNPGCVNPSHLYAGTHADNMRDAAERKRWPYHKGEKSWYHKLNNQKVLAIRRYRNKLSANKVAKMFDTSPTNVYLIWERKRWAHI